MICNGCGRDTEDIKRCNGCGSYLCRDCWEEVCGGLQVTWESDVCSECFAEGGGDDFTDTEIEPSQDDNFLDQEEERG